jgi:predicted N-acetyltransferase YhbS
MIIRLEGPKVEDASELGRIMFEAFEQISRQHGFPPDLPEMPSALHLMQMLISQRGVFGVAALEDHRVVGSNFVNMIDPVAGIGPITIDPAHQGNGIGRQLMYEVLNHAHAQGAHMIRLVQDSFNMTSLSLYASFGFVVREPLALLRAPSERQKSVGVRLATPDDIGDMDALCERNMKVSRRNAIAAAFNGPFGPLIRECGSKIVAYQIPGFFGHGAAETDEDALALIRATSDLPPTAQVFFAPLRQATLYRKALAAGCRTIKVMNLMTIGPYEEPTATWIPSVMY